MTTTTSQPKGAALRPPGEPEARSAAPVAIVTGGAGGIGRAAVAMLARGGYFVYAVDCTSQLVERAPVAADGVAFVNSDVRLAPDMDAVAARAIDERGRIDVLCCCAGIKTYGDALELTLDDWGRTIDVNLNGTFHAVRAVLPAMRTSQSGVIITIGSPSGYAERGALAYAASKGALLAFTRSLAIDCLGDHVRVNAVVPGVTRTGMTGRLDADQLEVRGRRNVTGRINEPADIAEVIAFLVSPSAATVSGAIIEVGKVQGEMANVPDRRSGDETLVASSTPYQGGSS